MDICEVIDRLDLPSGEYVVLGSGILGALGIRDIKDVDLLVTPRLFAQLRKRGWRYSTVDIEGQMREKLTFGVAEAFQDFWYGDQNPDPAQLFATAELIKGVPFLSLAALLKIKQVLGRPKDKADIILIENYLARLAIPQSQLIDKAYVDMLRSNMSDPSVSSVVSHRKGEQL